MEIRDRPIYLLPASQHNTADARMRRGATTLITWAARPARSKAGRGDAKEDIFGRKLFVCWARPGRHNHKGRVLILTERPPVFDAYFRALRGAVGVPPPRPPDPGPIAGCGGLG